MSKMEAQPAKRSLCKHECWEWMESWVNVYYWDEHERVKDSNASDPWNGKGILRLDKGLEEWQRFPLVQVWMLTFYAETIVLWDDSNLTLVPYRDTLLRSFTCLPIYTVKCADFGGCCWCISVKSAWPTQAKLFCKCVCRGWGWDKSKTL